MRYCTFTAVTFRGFGIRKKVVLMCNVTSKLTISHSVSPSVGTLFNELNVLLY